MGQLALKALQSDVSASVTITNRSPERAEEVAASHGGEVVPWEQRHRALAEADLALVATGAPEPVIFSSEVPAPHSSDEQLLVDIARPRNVDPSLDDRSGYEVFDLDDLQAWTRTVRERRSTAVPDAKAICDDLLSDFVTWVFHQQALQPAIQAIRETFDSIRQQEVDRHAHRTDMDREEVERLTKSIMQKLLAVPIVRLKNVDPDSIDFVQGIQLLHALFAPSDDAGGRSLREAPDDEEPSLAEAPSHCPYLTHDPGDEDASESEAVQEALRLAEELPDSSTASTEAVPHE
jgi:glutamyl-tRNA reductase